jgi:hypothetical protein
MNYKVFALFPTREYEVETIENAVALKNKTKHKLIWMNYPKDEIFVIYSANAYYTYILETEYRINKLKEALQSTQTKIDQEEKYSNKLIKNFFIDSSKNVNVYMNGSTSVIVNYQPRGRKYIITCTRTREKKIRLTVNILANIELIILRLLFELPIIDSEYVIKH